MDPDQISACYLPEIGAWRQNLSRISLLIHMATPTTPANPLGHTAGLEGTRVPQAPFGKAKFYLLVLTLEVLHMHHFYGEAPSAPKLQMNSRLLIRVTLDSSLSSVIFPPPLMDLLPREACAFKPKSLGPTDHPDNG